MEVKKKFEKPQMEVLKLKPAYMVSACSSHTPSCPLHCGDDCGEYEECGAWD